LEVIAYRVVEAERPEVREFLSRQWPLADRRLSVPRLDGCQSDCE
jgi:hypothetical protein